MNFYLHNHLLMQRRIVAAIANSSSGRRAVLVNSEGALEIVIPSAAKNLQRGGYFLCGIYDARKGAFSAKCLMEDIEATLQLATDRVLAA